MCCCFLLLSHFAQWFFLIGAYTSRILVDYIERLKDRAKQNYTLWHMCLKKKNIPVYIIFRYKILSWYRHSRNQSTTNESPFQLLIRLIFYFNVRRNVFVRHKFTLLYMICILCFCESLSTSFLFAMDNVRWYNQHPNRVHCVQYNCDKWPALVDYSQQITKHKI